MDKDTINGLEIILMVFFLYCFTLLVITILIKGTNVVTMNPKYYNDNMNTTTTTEYWNTINEVAIGSYVASNKMLLAATFFHLKHRKREPEGVHRQLDNGCNRNLRPKAAVGKVHMHVWSSGFSIDWAFGRLGFGRLGCNRWAV